MSTKSNHSGSFYGGGEDLGDLDISEVHLERQNSLDGQGHAMIGCHRGQFEILNVRNPQPGEHYVWIHDNQKGRTQAMTRGGRIVQTGDPEYQAYSELHGETHGGDVDGIVRANELMLVAIPEHRIRAEREAEQAQREAKLSGGVTEAAYMSASPDQRAIEAQYNTSNLKIMHPKHRTRNTAGPNESDAELSSWDGTGQR